ncbi:MAG: homocysteine S-methyltransferase family protein [Negativicutes bacterium]|jgi:5-methyltetrahydrofolate--homocysteine methyltransferase
MLKIIDGGLGTMLHAAGLTPGECPELWNIAKPEIITAVHRAYIDAGADIIETNTFGANFIKLQEYQLEERHDEINLKAAQNARAALRSNQLVAGSIGPTGKMLQPLGELSFDDAYTCFVRQISVLDAAGVDLFIIETMIDLQEARAALVAAKSVTKKPVFCHLSFAANGRTMSGTDAQTAAIVLDKLGADVIGVNCSTGPAEMLEIIRTLRTATNKPISALPNAGLPILFQGNTMFPMQPAEFAEWATRLYEAGADYIGGCCGTTPEHIAAVVRKLQSCKTTKRSVNLANSLQLCSRTKTITVCPESAPLIIGERINPTNRKQLAAELRAGSLATVINDALAQKNHHADVLDINVGISGINQAETMKNIICKLSGLVDTPLAIDTTDVQVLETGLKNFPGRALINSVSYEHNRLLPFLKLAKKYGAAVLVLPVTDDGLPETDDTRLDIAKRIIAAGKQLGLSDNDFILDPLALSAAADLTACAVTLATIRRYCSELKLPVTMGLSNASYGLPERPAFNAAFLLAAIGAGLTMPILNPLDESMQKTLATARLICGRDDSAIEYIEATKRFSSCQVTKLPTEIELSSNGTALQSLAQAVYNGNKELAALTAKAAVANFSLLEISEQGIAAGIVKAGDEYNAGTLYLPQILLAAEAAKAAFDAIKTDTPLKPIGKVMLGTVYGDIHDLGKNIVAALLANSGFLITDLGKNVSRETFLKEYLKSKPDIIGFSSLMTTTMIEIQPAIELLRANGCTAKFIIGGAVTTAEYATEVGADAFAFDAVEAVAVCKRLMKR